MCNACSLNEVLKLHFMDSIVYLVTKLLLGKNSFLLKHLFLCIFRYLGIFIIFKKTKIEM